MEKKDKFYVGDYIKNNYKLFIPIALMLVLFAAFFFYYQFSLKNSYHVDTKGNFYQYFYDKKYEYEAIVSKNKREVIVDFQKKDEDIQEDSTPIYDKNSDIVIFSQDMSVVMPTFNCSEYLSKGYSYIEYTKKSYKLTTNRYSNNLGHYFLYDGEDLYFFIEDTVLSVDGEEISLSPLSYVIAKYGKYVAYYDKKSDTFKTISVDNDDTFIKNDYYTIYVSRDIIDYYGTNVILTNQIDVLNTIDKKG